jgi:hypothetical protein
MSAQGNTGVLSRCGAWCVLCMLLLQNSQVLIIWISYNIEHIIFVLRGRYTCASQQTSAFNPISCCWISARAVVQLWRVPYHQNLPVSSSTRHLHTVMPPHAHAV